MNVHLALHEPPAAPEAPSERPRGGRGEVAWFLAAVYAIVVAISLALPGTLAQPGPAPLLAMLTPAVVVGLLALRRRGRADRAIPLGLRRLGLAAWPAAIVLPIVAVGLPYVLADLFGIVQVVDIGGLLANAPIQLGLLTMLCLGEEIGWRGFMLPRMAADSSPRRASLITGLAQSGLHLPLILLTYSYDSAGNRGIVATGAVAVITLAGVLFGWLRIRTGSLWPVTIAHAAVNCCIIEAPYLTSRDLDVAAYVTGEAGALTLAGTVLVAAWIWRRANWTPRHSS